MKKLLTFSGITLMAFAAITAPATAGPGAAEIAKGKAQFLRCQSCHSIDPKVQRGIGPNLANIVGKPAGQQDGFRYSRGLTNAKFSWTPEKLDAFSGQAAQCRAGHNDGFCRNARCKSAQGVNRLPFPIEKVSGDRLRPIARGQ